MRPIKKFEIGVGLIGIAILNATLGRWIDFIAGAVGLGFILFSFLETREKAEVEVTPKE